MSCNGCRVLRKGCTENCILRQSIQGIESPQAQSNATVFVAKFFGRAGLMSFLSGVPEPQRPALFQSLLFEACGRTVNPVHGAVGLLSTGNWHVCKSAVETVLRGGTLRQMLEFPVGAPAPTSDEVDLFRSENNLNFRCKDSKRKEFDDLVRSEKTDLDLRLTQSFAPRVTAGGRVKRRVNSPSLNSEEESETTTMESGSEYHQRLQGQGDSKLLRLFF